MRVLGIESSADALQMARRNQELNAITNIEWREANCFDFLKSADQKGERGTGERHDRKQASAQSVPNDDGALSEAFGLGRPNIVGAQDLEHAGAGQACDVGHVDER